MTKQRTINTREELDALSVESVVRCHKGFVWEKDDDADEPDFPWWATPGDRRQYSSSSVKLPAMLIYEPLS